VIPLRRERPGGTGCRLVWRSGVLSVASLTIVLFTACSTGPPDAEETVVLVHGLGRTPASMLILQERLADAGFRVVNFGYPSRSEPLEALTDSLRSAVAHCCSDGNGHLHFVTHSMGGVLVRLLLAGRAEPFEGRVVMLSPPNQGSEIVDEFSDSPLLRALLGPAGVRLGTDSMGIASELPPVDFSLGIITGDRSINPIGSWLIPGPDDGKVAVENARVEGADDFLVIPATHTFIMNRADVAELVVHFLRYGAFEDPPDDG
jgi:pimeloyl-ACP methyl ester carboxylesterase